MENVSYDSTASILDFSKPVGSDADSLLMWQEEAMSSNPFGQVAPQPVAYQPSLQPLPVHQLPVFRPVVHQPVAHQMPHHLAHQPLAPTHAAPPRPAILPVATAVPMMRDQPSQPRVETRPVAPQAVFVPAAQPSQPQPVADLSYLVQRPAATTATAAALSVTSTGLLPTPFALTVGSEKAVSYSTQRSRTFGAAKVPTSNRMVLVQPLVAAYHADVRRERRRAALGRMIAALVVTAVAAGAYLAYLTFLR